MFGNTAKTKLQKGEVNEFLIYRRLVNCFSGFRGVCSRSTEQY